VAARAVSKVAARVVSKVAARVVSKVAARAVDNPVKKRARWGRTYSPRLPK
jgi:hypothetical protein